MKHDQFIFQPGKKLRLDQFKTDSTGDFKDEQEAQASLQEDAENLAKYQDILMAHETYGLLLLFQAMDGAGKDATIKHVMGSVDPQGVEVKMFKRPTEKDLKHDYLWRAAQGVPALGQIGLFNRSYYEQVIGERVHADEPDYYVPVEANGEKVWAQRFRQINAFEQYLVENNIHVLKFFLHLSKEAQRERLLERISRPDKRWKFSSKDVEERQYWDEYMQVYEDMLRHTSTEHAPWYVIPADHRWFTRATVASIVVAKLKSLHSDYPELSDKQQQELEEARQTLEKE